MHLASHYGHLEIAKALLDNGALVNIADEQETPLFYAVTKDDDGYLHGTVENHIV